MVHFNNSGIHYPLRSAAELRRKQSAIAEQRAFYKILGGAAEGEAPRKALASGSSTCPALLVTKRSNRPEELLQLDPSHFRIHGARAFQFTLHQADCGHIEPRQVYVPDFLQRLEPGIP